jgi:hypothetical protein
MVIPLDEVFSGAVGHIFWYEKTEHIVPEEEAFKIRQKAIADSINGAIQNAIYNRNSSDVGNAMQKGWNSANQQIDMIENGTEMKSIKIMIGLDNIINLIEETESNPNFRGWVNSYIISEIRQYYKNQ